MSIDRILASVFVLALALVAHGSGVSGGFVYDDHRFVEQNPHLDTIDVGAYFQDPATASSSDGIQHDIYRPVRTLSYAVCAAAFGREDPRPFHVGSLLAHALASLLVLGVALPVLGGRLLMAAAAAAIFAVHPVGVESVAWISSRGDVQALVFMLLALIVMARPGAWRTVVGVGLGLLACFAKESALVLPALLLLRDLGLPADRRMGWRTTWLRTGLLGLGVGIYLVIRLQVIPGLDQVGDFPGGSRASASRGMLAGLGWYASALVWPQGFPFDIQIPIPARWTEPAVVVGLGLLVSLLLAGALGVRRRTALAFATLGALACLVPVSNVLVPLKALVAERFLYPVLMCFAVGIAWGIGRLPRRVGLGALVVLIPVLGGLVFISQERTKAWASEPALWERVLRDRPDHVRAYEGLGYEYLRAGRIRDAEIAYRSYLEANPIDGKGMALLGRAFGEVARSFRFVRRQQGVTIEGGGKEMARGIELALLEDALTTWSRVGLVRGRGSPELLRQVHAMIMEAAYDVSDYRRVSRANDDLLALDGFDPGDMERVLSEAPFVRRRWRLNLAFEMLTRIEDPKLNAEGRRRLRVERAAILRRAGIDPSQGPQAGLRRLLGRYEALAADPEAGPRTHDNLALLLETMGRREAAEDVIRRAEARWPEDPIWRSRR